MGEATRLDKEIAALFATQGENRDQAATTALFAKLGEWADPWRWGRAPAAATAELLELIDIGQHLGDGGEEPLRDLLANLGGVVKGPG